MDKKSLRPQVAQLVSHITIQNLPTELVELSENDLLSVVGGKGNHVNVVDPCTPHWRFGRIPVGHPRCSPMRPRELDIEL
jgi:hypothetical protein